MRSGTEGVTALSEANAVLLRSILGLVVVLWGCSGERKSPSQSVPTPPPSILLVTLDTTRADSIGPGAMGVDTPAFNTLAGRGRLFRQAYATAPQTLPSHSSMLTGLYPAGHGVHENGRPLAEAHGVAAERLRDAHYRTAAFVSAYPLARRFGLARGFETYDDQFESERTSRETTDRALSWLERQSASTPLFLWVHYFDPHHPYEPPAPFRGSSDPYRGEIAAMDVQLGRLLKAFERRSPVAMIVASDHGEGLGDHGEAQHGNLLYQSVMHVPMLIAGPGVKSGVSDTPVSTRRIFHTILDWAGLGAGDSLRSEESEVVLGEAMAPFLDYGWQPQVMAVEANQKVLSAGGLEVYDVIADSGEEHDLSKTANLSRSIRQAIRDYPLPNPNAKPASPALDQEARRRLASLGYIASDVRPVVRKDAPRPRDMVHLFAELEQAAGMFERQEYARAIPILEKILQQDPHNVMTAVQLAVAHSSLGQEAAALAAFKRAEAMAPGSDDIRYYLALHYARSGDAHQAVPMLERIVAESPDRLPALEALARLYERERRMEDAFRLRQKIYALEAPSAAELVHFGELAMAIGRTPAAIESFEKARAMLGKQFRNHLELGVLYLASRRLVEAKDSLDRVAPSHPGYAMALFKRAQVSVLLNEPDRWSRIERAKAHADASTRELITRERLFEE